MLQAFTPELLVTGDVYRGIETAGSDGKGRPVESAFLRWAVRT